MVTTKRERLKVIYDILKIIKEHHNAIKPTPLLRISNLSFTSFSEYEQELLQKDFIRILGDSTRKEYTLTDKGFKYLEKYKVIIEFISEFEL